MATKKVNYKRQARHKPLVKACLDRDPEKVVNFLKKKGTVPNLLMDLCGEDAAAWEDIYDTAAPNRESAAVGKPYGAGVRLLIKGVHWKRTTPGRNSQPNHNYFYFNWGC
jgi:hypothetical protein